MFIWSSEVVFDEQTKSEMQESKRELLGDDSYVLSEEDIADELQQELEDERCNLNKTIDGVIIVFGDLGLWNGRRQGYQILGNNIVNTMVNNSDIYSKSSEDVLDIVLTELGNQTGTVISESQKADIISNTTRIVNSFDANKTVEEYYNELIQQTSDLKQKEALEICSIVLDGLQYVDDNDIIHRKCHYNC